MRSHYYGPRDRSKEHRLEMYEVTLKVVLCHSITKSYEREFDEERDYDDCYGLHAFEGARFVIFIRNDAVTHSVIAHEVFHATCRIMERLSVNLKPDNHEAHALLVGWITATVYSDLKAWKAKIK